MVDWVIIYKIMYNINWCIICSVLLNQLKSSKKNPIEHHIDKFES